MWRRARVRVTSLLVGGGVGIAAAVQNRSTKPISTSVPSRTWNAMVSSGGSVSSSSGVGNRGSSTIGKPYAGRTISLRQTSTSSTRQIRTPVLIVGAGPVGTYLSLLLSRFGVPNILVDRGERGGDHGLGDKGDAHPRAHVLHTRTMELMREIGVDGELFEAMPPSQQWRKFIYCTSLLGEDIASIDHFNCGDGLYENLTESSPTHLAHLSQPVLERVLSREAKNWASRALGRSPDRSSSTPCNLLVRTEVSSVREEGSSIIASLVQTDVGGGKHSIEVTADYIVGCDGARSSVRASAGIAVSGRRGIEHFMSVHFRCPGLWEQMRGRGAMLYFIFNEGVVACLVAHDLEKGEWVAQLPFFPDVHPAGLSASTVRKQVAECIGHGPGGDPPEFTIVSSKAWSMDGAVADTFQKGRIFLAGDAAHQFPPSGGFGLNTGLQDAHNLAWKLACVVSSAAPDALLATYTLERKPVAHANSNLSIENHRRGLIGMQATGLKREWLDQTAEVIKGVPLLPSWAKAQALEMAVGAGMAPFTLLQKGEKSLVATLVGVPWSRAMRQAVEEGRCLPLLFPLHDLGVTYPSSASIFGAVAPPGDATPGAKYYPSGTPSDEKYRPSGAAGGRIPHARLEALGVGTLGDKDDFSSLDLVREGMREGYAPLHVLIVFGREEDASRWTSLSSGQDLSKRVVVVRIVEERDAELRGAGAEGKGGEDGVVYVDQRGRFASACGVERGGALLVRPDGHIAWRSRGLYVKGGEEAAALQRWFGSGGF